MHRPTRTTTMSRRALPAIAAALTAVAIPASLVAGSSSASADPAPSYELFGDASIVAGGHPGLAAQIGNDGGTAFGGVDFTNTGVTTLADLNELSTDYDFTEGTCEAGTPRFGATVTKGTDTGTVFFYIGPPPNYTECSDDQWATTGNLAAQTSVVDDSQLPGGSFYDPYSAAQDKYGDYTVTDLFVVSDSSSGTAQTLLLDNTEVGSASYDYGQVTRSDCKHGGYADFTDPSFKNQGQCIAYANHHDGRGNDDNHAHGKS
ncbi:MAG TPA: hypothetical protein VFJ19_06745 [Nocardioidaceae bacterium]|nr:hypothetical protein [Nocardioidaceae bacterium]